MFLRAYVLDIIIVESLSNSQVCYQVKNGDKWGIKFFQQKQVTAWSYNKCPKQAGTELGQAQLKLGLDFSLIFCRIGFSPLRLIELVWLNRFGLAFYISKILLGRFSL